MSFLAGNDTRDLWALLGGVGAVTVALGWWTWRESAVVGRVVTECMDGSVIGLWHEQVRRRPGRTRDQRARLAVRFPGVARGGLRNLVGEDLGPGDLSATRIREGGAGEAPWVVEGLDRDRAHLAIQWGFESAESGLAALRLLDQRVVRSARGGGGEPLAVSEREFDSICDRDAS
jgi:hypothetical protein